MTIKTSNTALFCLSLSLSTAWTTTAPAAEPEDIIKYRQGVMASVGGHTAAAAQIVRGKVDYADDLAYHAESIARSIRTVESLFPAGSDFGETRALNSVWSKPEDFKRVAEDARQATAAFVAAVKANDQAALVDKFKAMVDACKACHKDFRQEDE